MNKKLFIVSGLCFGVLAAPHCFAGQPLPTRIADINTTTHISKVQKGNGACSSPDDIRTDKTDYLAAVKTLYNDLYGAVADTDQAIKLNSMLGTFFNQSLNRQPASPQGKPKVPRTVVSH